MAPPSGGGGEWLMDVAALGITAVLVGMVVLIRRWLMLRWRKPPAGVPREPVLPLSPHGTLHDPKYLGRILEADEPPAGPDAHPTRSPSTPCQPR
ncbi:MAG: hypothetical protein QUV07_10280 [Cyanobium sp. CZS 25K]|nr:hypothetical protein [Cyanobium sp. CZS25K]